MSPTSYSPAQKWLHWLIFLLVVGLYGITYVEGFFQRGDPRRAMVWWFHISFGLMFATLVLVRLGVRLSAGAPDLPASMTIGERRLAHLGHAALYALLVAIPAVGVVLTWMRGDALTFFSLFTIPSPLATDREAARTVKEVHELGANLILALAALHALAALWHHYVRRDEVLRRMLPNGPFGKADAAD